MSNVDRKAGPPGGPGDVAAAAPPPIVEADAGPPGGPGDYIEAEEEAEEES